jgi:hypothetical protein
MVLGSGGLALARATHAGAWHGADTPQSASVWQGSSLRLGAGSWQRNEIALSGGGGGCFGSAGRGGAVAPGAAVAVWTGGGGT